METLCNGESTRRRVNIEEQQLIGWEGRIMPALLDESSEVTIISLIKELGEVKRLVTIADARAAERWDASQRALTLQAGEIDRRLEHLNGEAARIAEERVSLTLQMRREMEAGFRASTTDINNVREILSSFMAEQRGINKGMNLIWTIIVATLTVAIAAVGVWISIK